MTRHRGMLRLLGGGALVALLALGIVAPRAAAGGWLIAFAFVGAPILGSAALLMIHALTGGRWGDAARPALAAAASATPLVLVFFLLVLVGASTIYPWIAAPQAAGPGVAAIYLDLPLYAARGVVFLLGLAIFAASAARDRLGRLTAGLGLVWYCIGMDLVAVDWLLSLEPRYTSSAFGAQIIVAQLVASLCVAILCGDADAAGGAWNDLASLLLATLLGEAYLILMTFIVHWYGDLPEQAAFYLARSTHGWGLLEVAGVTIGAVGPLIALLFTRVRHGARALKLAAAAALAGVLIEMVWLVAPVTDGWSGLVAILGVVAAGGLAAGFADTLQGLTAPRPRHGV